MAARKSNAERVADLRARRIAVSVNGRELSPGSAEYERALKDLVERTTEDELVRGPQRGGAPKKQ